MSITEDIMNMSDEEFLKQASELSKKVATGSYTEEELEDDSTVVDNVTPEPTEEPVEEEQEIVYEDYSLDTDEPEEEVTESSIFDVIKELDHFNPDNPEDVKLVLERGVEKIKESLSPEAEQKSVIYNTLALNKLADTKTLATMIDIMKGNVEAIGSLINSLNIDPTDFYSITSKLNDYNPSTQLATKNDIILNEAATKLSAESLGREVLNDVSTWDKVSKDQIARNASVLFSLRDQKFTGMYDRVKARMQMNRAKGKMYSSDFEAYTMALNEIEAEEAQKRLNKATSTKSLSSPGSVTSKQSKQTKSLMDIASIEDDQEFLLMANQLLKGK